MGLQGLTGLGGGATGFLNKGLLGTAFDTEWMVVGGGWWWLVVVGGGWWWIDMPVILG